MAKTKLERFQERMAKMEHNIVVATGKANMAISDAAHKGRGRNSRVDELAAVLAEFQDCLQSSTKPVMSLLAFLGVDQELITKAYNQAQHEGEPTPFPFKEWAVIKLTENPNNHDYPLNKPLVIVSDRCAVYWDKNQWVDDYDDLPCDPACYKTATKAEVQFVLDHLDTFPTTPTIE